MWVGENEWKKARTDYLQAQCAMEYTTQNDTHSSFSFSTLCGWDVCLCKKTELDKPEAFWHNDGRVGCLCNKHGALNA